MVGGTYTAYHNKGGFTRACLLWRHHLRASTPVMLEYSNFNFHLGTRPCLHLTGASTCMGKHAPCTCKPGMSTKCIKSIYIRFTYNKSTQLHNYTNTRWSIAYHIPIVDRWFRTTKRWAAELDKPGLRGGVSQRRPL